MTNEDSLVQLFYNLIPGVLFLWLLNYYNLFPTKVIFSNPLFDNELVKAIFLTSLSLFLGFVFQGVTKITGKDFFLNIKAIKAIKNQNSKAVDLAIKKIKKPSFNKEDDRELSELFYFMDNFLRGKEGSFIVNHFSTRLAIWSNTSVALLVFFILRTTIFLNPPHSLLPSDGWLFILFIFSLLMLWRYLNTFYDCILKTFNAHYKKP